ncbi:unnamed protein product [Dibothriocephalus latus]|uniref:C-type lectin domain-containing protein n=1 Tax=Dibothriocephalus latus TaxID=60516 RepID=A0A3P7M8R2_DIBLA|nr:unnamed protein product [Dibothriocephalus latus]
MACGMWLLLSVFSFLEPCKGQNRDRFNPAGPEYIGIFGGLKYYIYASVEATHGDANTLCSIYDNQGRLAWFGDLEVPELRAIAEKASMINYLNLNHFFWIDGRLLNKSCNTGHDPCIWGPETHDSEVLSHIAPGVSNTFKTTNMACEKLESEQNRKEMEMEMEGKIERRPVLMPNLLEEFPDEDKDYVLAAAWNFEKSGFICSAPESDVVECPFGFTEIETCDVPKHLIPKPGFDCK